MAREVTFKLNLKIDGQEHLSEAFHSDCDLS